jgi:transposase InsO family protein
MGFAARPRNGYGRQGHPFVPVGLLAMPRFIPVATRLAVYDSHQNGLGTAEVAALYQLAPRTVRFIVRQGRAAAGAFQPPRYPSGPQASAFSPSLRQQILGLRQQHSRWGAALLRLCLADLRPDDELPSEPTIRRWLRGADLAPARAGRKSAPRPRSCTPHEVWQVDAADQMRLLNGQLVSWLRLVDECSGAALQTIVFPTVWNSVEAPAVQQALRKVFARWGLPGHLRLDNGFPWGNWNDLPTALALWLSGLGLGLIFNRPRHPQENGVVERSHQTADAWVEPATCCSPEQLQQRLDEMDRIQRERYPRVCGLSRWQLYPTLRQGGACYSESWEQQNWSLQAARQYLSRHVGRRKVSSQGQVRVYAGRYYVGVLHKAKQAQLQYDPLANEWVFSDEQGRQWSRRPAEQISQDRIMGLAVSA